VFVLLIVGNFAGCCCIGIVDDIDLIQNPLRDILALVEDVLAFMDGNGRAASYGKGVIFRL
jgi:hypothetical protein